MQMLTIFTALLLMLGSTQAQQSERFTHWQGSVPLNELVRLDSPVEQISVAGAMRTVYTAWPALDFVEWRMSEGIATAAQQTPLWEVLAGSVFKAPVIQLRIGEMLPLDSWIEDKFPRSFRSTVLPNIDSIMSDLRLRYDGMWYSDYRRIRMGLGYQVPFAPKSQLFVDVDQPRQPIIGIQWTVF